MKVLQINEELRKYTRNIDEEEDPFGKLNAQAFEFIYRLEDTLIEAQKEINKLTERVVWLEMERLKKRMFNYDKM